MSSDARDLIDAVQTLAPPTEVDPAKSYVVTVAGEGVVEHIEPDESRAQHPFRARGDTTAFDVDAFSSLWAKHAADGISELYGDPLRFTFTGVLNADDPHQHPGFRDHRLLLPLRKTKAWLAWTGFAGKMHSQVEFAEFIEDRLGDIVRPSGADMLEVATTLEANSSVTFKSAVSLSSGVRTLNFEETQGARAGQSGQLEIPRDIELALTPFEGGEPYKVTARFRHRIRNGQLALGVILDRPEDVEKAAFDGYAELLGQACTANVLLGTPPPPTLQV